MSKNWDPGTPIRRGKMIVSVLDGDTPCWRPVSLEACVCSISGDGGPGTLGYCIGNPAGVSTWRRQPGRCTRSDGSAFLCWPGVPLSWGESKPGVGRGRWNRTSPWPAARGCAHGVLSLLGPTSCLLGSAWFLVTRVCFTAYERSPNELRARGPVSVSCGLCSAAEDRPRSRCRAPRLTGREMG